jgi:hypothetical protein
MDSVGDLSDSNQSMVGKQKRRTYCFPRSDLRIGPDARSVLVSPGTRCNKGRFGDEKTAGGAGALFVVLRDVRERYMVGVGAEPCGRRKHYAVAELDISNLGRLEEFGARHWQEALDAWKMLLLFLVMADSLYTEQKPDPLKIRAARRQRA